MAALNLDIDPTLAAIDEQLVIVDRSEPPRGYIGMSAIGGECARKIYFDFHWTSPPDFNAATLKKFQDGHAGEDMQAERLRLVPGIKLITHQSDGEQFGFNDLGGHFAGHIDGAILGLLQAGKRWHVWEHKQTNQTLFNKLKKLKDEVGEKNALKAWSMTYYGQAVLYMHYSGMKRHYLTVSTPGGRDTISVRTEPDTQHAKQLKQLAHDIIVSDKPQQVPRCSDSPSWYYCKQFCNHSNTCHGDQLPQINCRTCAHSTPHITDDNTAVWRCHIDDPAHDIPEEVQRTGCKHHIYNPGFLDNWAEPVSANPAENSITYMFRKTKREFTNGNGVGEFTSAELLALDNPLISDENIQTLKTDFEGTIDNGQ